MTSSTISYKEPRFPPQIIARAVWLYFRFPLSLRLVEEMLLERGIVVSYETIRRWCRKFGAARSGSGNLNSGDKWNFCLLCLAFRELGRVERTLFLLQYISQPQTRQAIRAETTKIESFNDFLDWITFGGPVIKSGDPVEQEKQLKYASLVANAIMLSNVADLSAAITDMTSDGHPVTPELAAAISPYIRKHIRRFGKYDLDMDDRPGPLVPQDLPFEIPL